MKISVLFVLLAVLSLAALSQAYYYRAFGKRDDSDDREVEKSDEPAEMSDEPAEKSDEPAANGFVTKNEKTTPSTSQVRMSPKGFRNRGNGFHVWKHIYVAKSDAPHHFHLHVGPDKNCQFSLHVTHNNKGLSKSYSMNNKFWTYFFVYYSLHLRTNDKLFFRLAYQNCKFLK